MGWLSWSEPMFVVRTRQRDKYGKGQGRKGGKVRVSKGERSEGSESGSGRREYVWRKGMEGRKERWS